MPKTREEVELFLKNLAADNNYAGGMYDAAIDILANAIQYDYMGEDRAFLAHCEDIVAETEGYVASGW